LIDFNGSGTLSLTGGSAGSRAFALIYAEGSSTQTIQGASTISLTGGSGGGFYNSTTNSYEGNRATIGNGKGAQTISAGSILLTGGAAGTLNTAQISSSGMQTLTATHALRLTGGAGGGGTLDDDGTVINLGNGAYITSYGGRQQTISAGSVALTGGGGNLTGHAAMIDQYGTLGEQRITVTGTGNLTLQGGTSAGSDVGFAGSFASIYSEGSLQTVSMGGGGLSLTGGNTGGRSFANIWAQNASTQSVTGVGAITITGGASGGNTGALTSEGNGARIVANAGSQTIQAASLSLMGGSVAAQGRRTRPTSQQAAHRTSAHQT
jgi:hypothetical protein